MYKYIYIYIMYHYVCIYIYIYTSLIFVYMFGPSHLLDIASESNPAKRVERNIESGWTS